MRIIGPDHGAAVSAHLQRAVGRAVPRGSLGCQGWAQGGGIGRVGRCVQRDLGGGGGVAEHGVRRPVGWRTTRGIRWGESGYVGGLRDSGRGVDCRAWGEVGGCEWGGIGERVRKRFRRRVRGWVGRSRPGCVRRRRFLRIRADCLPFGHVPHLIVPVEQLQGATHIQGNKRDEHNYNPVMCLYCKIHQDCWFVWLLWALCTVLKHAMKHANSAF